MACDFHFTQFYFTKISHKDNHCQGFVQVELLKKQN